MAREKCEEVMQLEQEIALLAQVPTHAHTHARRPKRRQTDKHTQMRRQIGL